MAKLSWWRKSNFRASRMHGMWRKSRRQFALVRWIWRDLRCLHQKARWGRSRTLARTCKRKETLKKLGVKAPSFKLIAFILALLLQYAIFIPCYNRRKREKRWECASHRKRTNARNVGTIAKVFLVLAAMFFAAFLSTFFPKLTGLVFAEYPIRWWHVLCIVAGIFAAKSVK